MLTKLADKMPVQGGFAIVPIRPPNGKLLATGARSYSKNITLISTSENPTFEVVGTLPGVARESPSTILVGGRFVVGFGGNDDGYLNDL